MHEKEGVGPKFAYWGTLTLIAYSEDEFISKWIRSSLPLKNNKIW